MRSMLLLMMVMVGLLAVPSGAWAATCADYTNQADAQRAADTRDGDGDGIYCEDLPCPCLKPGSSPPRHHHHKRRHRRKPALFKGKCKRGRLPDKHCTPGRAFSGVTGDDV